MAIIRVFILILLFTVTAIAGLNAQIKIYERNAAVTQSKDTAVISDSIRDSIKALNKSANPFSDKGLFFESPTRRKMMLNGEWNVSFNNGGSFAKLIVPCSYDFSGTAFFNRNFSIQPDTL
ncbi:MAG: hypothetical protein KBG21_07685, partial [Ignavibacteria bacterium]|nr:hypothetical protein [Ignavibacteria bacterium]